MDRPSGGISSCFSLLVSAIYAFHAAPLQAFASYQHCWTGGRRLLVAEKVVSSIPNGGREEGLLEAQPAVKVLNDSVALAGGLFESLAVHYLHGAAQVFNQSPPFEYCRCQTHAGASGAEHLRQEFMSQGK